MANCLTGEARSLLNELDHEGKRNYNTLIEKLRKRFSSVNKSEIYRTQLQSRIRNKGETIPEHAQAIKKIVRQAYPGVNKEVVETLSLDYFILMPLLFQTYVFACVKLDQNLLKMQNKPPCVLRRI